MKTNQQPTVRVLLAEPHSLVRAGLHAVIEREDGFTVVGEADNGDDLLKLVARGESDILVLEPQLPGLPSAQLISQAAALHAELKVVILVAPLDLPIGTTLLEMGASGCILKSDRPEEFLRAIRAAAEGELGISSSVALSVLRRVGSQPTIDPLTDRERQVLELLTSGLSNKEIAQKLYLSVRTVEVHLRNIYSKLGVRSRLEAVTRTALSSSAAYPPGLS